MKRKFAIIDCYVDEPACFGVPPFVSPYPRYIYGALIDAGISPEEISFYTIDSIREQNFKLPDNYVMTLIIGGAVVPGRYLGRKIGTAAEIRNIISENKDQEFAVGGLISHVLKTDEDNITLIKGDIEKFAHTFALGIPEDSFRSVEEIGRWSVKGADVVTVHPDYPFIIIEIETYRGCPRSHHCSFCSEGALMNIEFRTIKDILNEIDTLMNKGISRFRLGRQADILQYMTPQSEFKNGFPRPDPSPLKELFGELKLRTDSGQIGILNIDNANPGTIINFPDESEAIIQYITEAITPGDTMALGIESFDEQVISKNNLKVTGDQAIEVVRLINRIGGKRINGIPILLPGINLLHGLLGETKKTFAENYRYLSEILEADLLLKRINIRKIIPFPGTIMANNQQKISKDLENRFDYYKNKIRQDIDKEMLKRIYPIGTVVSDSLIMEHHADFSYGKQLASYSITTKYPLSLDLHSLQKGIVIGQRERSLITLPIPIHVNTLPQKALELIPGIGKRRASQIILERPYHSTRQLQWIKDTVDSALAEFINL